MRKNINGKRRKNQEVGRPNFKEIKNGRQKLICHPKYNNKAEKH